jgi:hypothetical protein
MWQVLYLLPSILAQTANLNGDFTVSGTLSCSALSTLSLTTAGSLSVSQTVSVQTLQATSVDTDRLVARTITPPSGVLRIEGDVVIARTASASFLQITQWKEVSLDDFEDGESGWSRGGIGTCGGAERFLGGYCVLSTEETAKNFTLPLHSSIRITANFHMFDLWQGESGYLKADKQVVWSQSGYSYENGLDICGGSAPDPRLGIAVDVTIHHSARSLELRFGSTLRKSACEASYGVAQVAVYIQ